MEEVTRLLNLEKQLPSYKYSVTVSCLKVLRKLQKCGHLPSNPKIYRSYAAYGQYIDVRIAALECLVDFVKVDGRWEDLQHLMDLLETDLDPMVRHALARLLIDNPPFERAHRHKLDREELVERIWGSMKYVLSLDICLDIFFNSKNFSTLLSHDSRLRCDMVDLYYALYGNKRPMCLPTPELSAMFKPPKVQPVQAEIKTRAPSPIDEKPIDIVDVVPIEAAIEVQESNPLKRTAEQSFQPTDLKVESQDVEAVKTIKVKLSELHWSMTHGRW